MRNRNRKLSIIFLTVMLLLLINIITSCQTQRVIERVAPSLPSYTPVKPERPKLIEIEDGVQLPISVVKNQILLEGYAKELELYSCGWEEFYEGLLESYANNERDKDNNK